MWISKLHIQNVKSFEDSGEIQFGKGINLLIGCNNSGKSTILRCLGGLQSNENGIAAFAQKHQRKGAESHHVAFELAEPNSKQFPIKHRELTSVIDWKPIIHVSGSKNSSEAFIEDPTPENRKATTKFGFDGHSIPKMEPDNLIYPFFANRKNTKFDQVVSAQNAKSINESFSHIYSKIDRLANPSYPASAQYADACQNILGFFVSCSLSNQGKEAGLVINETEHVAISDMGEGIINLLGLIVNLCVAKQKVFLIEELENDIHPKALKSLLEFLIKKADSNQFIISTHSNIVAKYLGSHPDTKIFSVSMELRDALPTSTVEMVENTAESRIKLLADLGYDLFDFELWRGYLLFEESTAERIVRDFLVPQFCPKLRSLKTIAAAGATDLEARFIDFLRLFVYIHTSEAYKHKAWVFADGDEAGKEAINKIKGKFSTWDASHFHTFEKESFELYYPSRFDEEVKCVLKLPHGKLKQAAKGRLAEDILAWARANPHEARSAFEESAKEIIQLLKNVEAFV